MPSDSSIDKKIERARDKYLAESLYHHCSQGNNNLDGRLQFQLFDQKKDERTNNRFPAVDLCAGLGVLTTLFALRYRQPAFRGTLDVHPTNRNPDITKSGFKCMAQEAETAEILFEDPNGTPVYAGDHVLLGGLSNEKFNQREGKVLAKDPKTEGRFGVKLVEEEKRKFEKGKISLKPENMHSYPCAGLETAVIRAMSTQEQQDFFQGLADRTCIFDLLNPIETWKNISHLSGKCTLVTCVDARSIYHASTWKDALFAASRLLKEGGYFVILDEFQGLDGDGFGNIMGMEGYSMEYGMGMILEGYNEPRGPGAMEKEVTMLWRKVHPGFDRIAEMDQMLGSGRMLEILQWEPEMPSNKMKETGDGD